MLDLLSLIIVIHHHLEIMNATMTFNELTMKILEIIEWPNIDRNCTSLSDQPSAYFFIKSKLNFLNINYSFFNFQTYILTDFLMINQNNSIAISFIYSIPNHFIIIIISFFLCNSILSIREVLLFVVVSFEF